MIIGQFDGMQKTCAISVDLLVLESCSRNCAPSLNCVPKLQLSVWGRWMYLIPGPTAAGIFAITLPRSLMGPFV